MLTLLLTMDFSRAGYVHSLPGAFRARAQWKDSGRPRECYGPRRPDEEAAKEDIESTRAAASGMSREDGFAAMKVEADELKAGKPPQQASTHSVRVCSLRRKGHFDISLGRGGQTKKPQKATLPPCAPQPAA